MRLSEFEYLSAETIEDVLEKLGRYGTGAMVLAGGTDLVVRMKERRDLPGHVISLKRVTELGRAAVDDGSTRLGAMSRFSDILNHPTICRNLPGLRQAVETIGSWQIRNVATIGGNLCSASPAADSVPPLVAAGARVVITGPGGDREMPVADFIRGPGRTALSLQEILREIVIDHPVNRSAGCFCKLMRRRAEDIAMASVAVQAEVDDTGGRLGRTAICLGGVGPGPIRVDEAEDMMSGRDPEAARALIGRAARVCALQARPSTGRASAEYRRGVVETFAGRALNRVVDELFE